MNKSSGTAFLGLVLFLSPFMLQCGALGTLTGFSPWDAGAKTARSREETMRSKAREAIKNHDMAALDALIAANPRDTELRFQKAAMQQALGDYAAANRTANEARSLNEFKNPITLIYSLASAQNEVAASYPKDSAEFRRALAAVCLTRRDFNATRPPGYSEFNTDGCP